MTESWKKVWREAVVPLLSLESLEALRTAIINDDPRLIQGATCVPPPLSCVEDWPVECACLLGYCGVSEMGGFDKDEKGAQNTGAATVGMTEEFFARMCFAIDQKLGEPAGCRWVLNWFDQTPRDEIRRLLLPEVDIAIGLKHWDMCPTTLEAPNVEWNEFL